MPVAGAVHELPHECGADAATLVAGRDADGGDAGDGRRRAVEAAGRGDEVTDHDTVDLSHELDALVGRPRGPRAADDLDLLVAGTARAGERGEDDFEDGPLVTGTRRADGGFHARRTGAVPI